MKQLLVTAGVFINNGKVLMSQRNSGAREGGKWEFPGGKVEAGEEPRACLKRELHEELGIKAEVFQVLEVVSVTEDDLHLILLYFFCTILEGEPLALDCQQVRWLTPGEIDHLEKPPADEWFWERWGTTFSTEKDPGSFCRF
jgi:8-oxo-dGTP diphosphatase